MMALTNDAKFTARLGRVCRRVWRTFSRRCNRHAFPSLMRLVLTLALAFSSSLFGQGARPAFAAAGDLDPTFDGDGIVINNFDSASGFLGPIATVAVQPDGKLVIAGSAQLPSAAEYDFKLARYLPSGALDPTFGVAGKVTTDLGGNDQVSEVAIQNDGRIIAIGKGGSPQTSGENGAALVRYNADGSVDTSFGNGGTVLVDESLLAVASKVALQASGMIVVGGKTSSGMMIAVRYTQTGSLDQSFGSNGRITFTNIYPFGDLVSVTATHEGKILIVAGVPGTTLPATMLARFTSNGAADGSFAAAGLVAHEGVRPAFVALQADGKIVVAGRIYFLEIPVLTRFTDDGSIDATFGGGGRRSINTEGVHTLSDVVVMPDGKIVAVGSNSTGGFTLRKYTSTGGLDPTFGIGGAVLTTNPAGNFELSARLVVQPDGKLVAAGRNSGVGSLLMARYQNGGVGGPSFGISPQSNGITLSWASGTGQVGYLLGRAPSTFFQSPAEATAYIDPAPLPGMNCYQLFSYGESSVLGVSDAICAQLGFRSTSGAPQDFTLRMHQETVGFLNWSSTSGALAYVVAAITQTEELRVITIRTSQYSPTGITDGIGGTPTCYIVYAVYATILGNTDVVCALPGQAKYSTSSPSAQVTATRGATAGTQASARAAASPLAGRAEQMRREITAKLPTVRGKVEEVAAKLRGNGRDPVPAPTPRRAR